jgi:tetratricopeptide (TPR) repeat protein
MTANGESAAGAVSDVEARAEAERLLADPRLHVSERHRAFLRYIIDALFEGRGNAVKAYSIAIDVFNRPSTFDPSSDPIVRIEATRLREALAKYYEQIGDEDGARLDIARGRYLPVFSPRSLTPRDQMPPASDDFEFPEEDLIATTPHPPRRTIFAVTGLVVGLVSIGSYALYHMSFPARLDTDRPIVELTSLTSQPPVDFSDTIAERLASSMNRFGTVRLTSATGHARGATETSNQTSYHLNVRYSETGNEVVLWSDMSDGVTGEKIWTNEERRSVAGKSRDDAVQELLFAVSRKVAGPAGVVNISELRRNLPLSTTGNLCVLRGEAAVEQRRPAGLRDSRPCLEATIAADPTDADAMATLARVYLWTGRATGDDSYFARGLDLANRAAMISPLSSRAALAQLATQYQVGQTETSIAAGRRGVALNPENADLRSKLALATYLSGQWSEGIRLAQESVELAGEGVQDGGFLMILDAYRKGQYAEAVFLARQIPAADTPTTVLKLAAVARMGDHAVIVREIAAARMQHPDLDRVVSAMFSGTRYHRDLEQALRVGIGEAGLKSPEFAHNGAM